MKADSYLAAKSLNEVLTARALKDTDTLWLTLYYRDKVYRTLTYGELYEGALKWAGELLKRGISSGARVLIILPTGVPFYESYLGVLLSGGIPVPLYPPVRMDRLGDYRRNLTTIVDNSTARFIVTDRKIRPFLGFAPEAVSVIVPSEVGKEIPEALPAVDGDQIALIQYTSGATGTQKGAVITHGNLLANIRAMGRALDVREEDKAVSWLPLYHDMGLIGNMLGALYWGVELVALSPIDFLRRPSRWLRMISNSGGTISAAPNFAYSLISRKVRESEISGLDLSKWRVALCGAEPISEVTVSLFKERFAPFGFDPGAFFPAYGLAENTLAVTFSELGKPPVIAEVDAEKLYIEGVVTEPAKGKKSRKIVSVGKPIEGVTVKIVGRDGGQLPPGHQGELVVNGPSVMRGYWRNDEETKRAIKEDGLHTGDLGFTMGGEYFICGRIKDLLIKGGRNYFAEDIELAASQVDGVRQGGIVAFSIYGEGGEEEIVVIVEAVSHREELAAEVSAMVSEVTGLRPDRVEVIAPRSIPKTSSGKLQRYKARQWYLEGRLGVGGGLSKSGFVSSLFGALRALFGAYDKKGGK
ncbi:MAG: hypothetical protein C0608_03640 [Deltaproteobacteria bacterium]|nr:MAG: hypothetical protein C0608_03640 [Deltaproteobacteria bacterium]